MLYLRDEKQDTALLSPITIFHNEPKQDIKEEDGIFCSTCHGLVTLKEYADKQNQSHEHTFANPVGVVYHICIF